jgi:hypothetical protein
MFAKNQFATHCGYTEKETAEKNFDFYSFRHFYRTMLDTSKIRESIVKYFMGHAVNIHDMSQNYNNREDLDDIFFEDNGLSVIQYIDALCEKVLKKYDLLPAESTHIEQVSLTDSKKQTKTFFTEVLDDFDFESEIYHLLGDFVEKGLLVSLNDKDGLKKLLETKQIDKRRYDDCMDYIQNNYDFT